MTCAILLFLASFTYVYGQYGAPPASPNGIFGVGPYAPATNGNGGAPSTNGNGVVPPANPKHCSTNSEDAEGTCEFDSKCLKVKYHCTIANAVMFQRKTGPTCEECIAECANFQSSDSPWICRGIVYDHRWFTCDLFALDGTEAPAFHVGYDGRDLFDVEGDGDCLAEYATGSTDTDTEGDDEDCTTTEASADEEESEDSKTTAESADDEITTDTTQSDSVTETTSATTEETTTAADERLLVRRKDGKALLEESWTSWSSCRNNSDGQSYQYRYLFCKKKMLRKCPKQMRLCEGAKEDEDLLLYDMIDTCVAIRDAKGEKRCPLGMKTLKNGRVIFCREPVDCDLDKDWIAKTFGVQLA